MRKLICAVLSVLLLLGAVATAWAEDTATLTITPDKTEVTADGNDIQVVFTVTVAPPQGKELGVFSFRLKPSGTMTLPKSFKVDGERVITYESLDLEYDINTDKGVFRTYEYTPGSCFFAAVGSSEGRRMTESAAILTIAATIPAGSTGTFTLDAEFVAAPDGSGTTYTPRVDSTPVTVKGTGGLGGSGGSGGSNSAEKPETGEPTSAETPDVTDKPDVPQGNLPAAADDPQAVSYTHLDVYKRQPEVWGSKYDVRELLRACYYAIDKKPISEAPLSFAEKEMLKIAIKKIKGTDIEILLKESGLIE